MGLARERIETEVPTASEALGNVGRPGGHRDEGIASTMPSRSRRASRIVNYLTPRSEG